MKKKQKEMILSNIILTAAIFYFLFFPFLANSMYNDSKARTFLRFYFAKKKCVSWFGYIISIIICSWSLVYYFIFKFLFLLTNIIYNIISPVCIFLFVSKRCKSKLKKGIK